MLHIQPDLTHIWCGWCGEAIKGFSLRIEESLESNPIYADVPAERKIKILIKNEGIGPITITEIEERES